MILKDFNSEYNPYYDSYLKFINIDDSINKRFDDNLSNTSKFFNVLDDKQLGYTYQKGKWTIAQIFQHIIDTERIFCYRALKIVREKEPIIMGYDHEEYAKTYKQANKYILLKDYYNNRKSSQSLFNTFTKSDLNKSIDHGHYKFKVGLIPFILCGHELHHMEIIQDRYLT